MFGGGQSEISIGAGRESSKPRKPNARQSRLRMKPGLA